MSRKSERLVNLTIALLATKRYLTKSEIFATVAGYSGEPEAKDRMFERDKDDLRSLGITIELGTFDPLFEDEAGYRIKPENYSFQLDNLDATSVAILSQAAQLWREAALDESAQSGLRKLKGLGIESDISELSHLSPSLHAIPEQLAEIIEAISEKRIITFEYLNEEMKGELRTVKPLRLSNSEGYWYLSGEDQDKKGLRTFRLDRFASSVSITSKKFEESDSLLEEIVTEIDEIEIATVSIRHGRGVHLRNQGTLISEGEEWDLYQIPILSRSQFLQNLLWSGVDACVVEPLHLREEVISILEQAVGNHG